MAWQRTVLAGTRALETGTVGELRPAVLKSQKRRLARAAKLIRLTAVASDLHLTRPCRWPCITAERFGRTGIRACVTRGKQVATRVFIDEYRCPPQNIEMIVVDYWRYHWLASEGPTQHSELEVAFIGHIERSVERTYLQIDRRSFQRRPVRGSHFLEKRTLFSTNGSLRYAGGPPSGRLRLEHGRFRTPKGPQDHFTTPPGAAWRAG